MTRPNVLLIWTDQQRWDTVGAGGFPLLKTPHLDRLGSAGTLFNNAYANCPVCMPSRQSALSGRYPGALGVRRNGIEMPPDIQCIHNVLSGYGYNTAQLGKLHFLNHASAFRDHHEPHPSYGFDTCIVSDEPGCYDDPYIAWVASHDPAAVDLCRVDTPPAWTGTPIRVHPRETHQPYAFDGPEELTHSAFVADLTCRYLHSRASRAKEGEPFFAVAGFYAPHAPINPPRRFIDWYDPAEMPPPVRAAGENFTDRTTGRPVTDEQWRIVRQHYYALVSHVDDCIGRILGALDELGLSDDTLVIFTSDHGENLGDHGLVGKTQWYDSSTRVPLIVKPPRREPTQGARHTTSRLDPASNGFVELVDLAPTIADYCAVPQPPFFQGRSLRPFIDGRGQSSSPEAGLRDSAFFEYGSSAGAGYKAVRAEQYLYARHRDGREHLYDLATDPGQTVDVLAGSEADATVSVRDLLGRARAELLGRLIDSESPYPRPTGEY